MTNCAIDAAFTILLMLVTSHHLNFQSGMISILQEMNMFTAALLFAALIGELKLWFPPQSGGAFDHP